MIRKRHYNAYVKISGSANNKEEAVSRAYRKLEDQLKAENFKQNLDRHRYFIGPGERRRIKSKAARARARSEARLAAMDR